MNTLDSMDLTVAFSTGKINPYKKMKLLMYKKSDKRVFNLIDIICAIDNNDSLDSFNSLDQEFLDNYSYLFNEIRTRYESINYEKEFQRKMKNNNYFLKQKHAKIDYGVPKECQYQVHPAQIQEGIRRICYKLLPSKFIGNPRNVKKIMKAFQHFLKTAKEEPYSLLNLVKSLNFESIAWMQAINSENHKHIMIGKFIKWLFLFFIALIERIFYMSHIHGKKIFIFILDWERQKNEYLKLMCKRPVLQLVNPAKKCVGTRSRLCFIPKCDGVRPITVFKYLDEEKNFLRQIVTVLQYLYKMNYTKSSRPYNELLIDIFKQSNCDNNRLYIVSCDINDAYGSILHTKLFDILQKMFQALPEKLIFQHSRVRKVDKCSLITKHTNPLSYDLQKCKFVEKHHLLQVLKSYIFETKITYKKKVYNVDRGVSQGLILSGILCSIYYAHMNTKYFASFQKEGNLFNYVDDYLYVTNQSNSAKQFLQLIQKGCSEYNCYFKSSKIQRHIDPQDSETIRYLGWQFHFEPFKIKPEYNSSRYSIIFKTLTSRTLIYKLKASAALKLDKLILTKKVTNNEQIFDNITLICRRQAERCFAMSIFLYNIQRTKVDIKLIIKVNNYILWKIENFTEWNKYERKINRNNVRFIMWNSFFNTFVKRYDIFSYLTVKFKSFVTKYKKKAHIEVICRHKERIFHGICK